MKTKTFLITALIILSGILNVNSVFAQDTNNTDNVNVTLNIILNPIQTIQVNPDPDQKTVNIVYSEIGDYQKGVSVNKHDHLQIFSTGGFEVKVNSADKLINNKREEILASDITVLATPGTENGLEKEEREAVALGSEQTLIKSETGGRDLKYNVTYNNELGGNDNYLNLYDKDANNIFTTDVTYTIIAY